MCSGYNPIRNVDVKKILGYTGGIRIYIFLSNYVVWKLQVQTSFQGLGLQPTWLQVPWDREFAPYQDCSVNTLEDYTNQMLAITLSTSSAGTDLALKWMNTIGTVKSGILWLYLILRRHNEWRGMINYYLCFLVMYREYPTFDCQ